MATCTFEKFDLQWENRRFAGNGTDKCRLARHDEHEARPGIEWDGAKELVVGDEAANKLLRREYRKGWSTAQVASGSAVVLGGNPSCARSVWRFE